MVSTTGVRQFAFLVIEQIPKGRKIALRDLYHKIETALSMQYSSGAGLPVEPPFGDDIRFAIRDAKDRGLIKQAGKPGQWRRT